MPNAEPTLGDLFPMSKEELSQKLSAAIDSDHGEAKGWSAPVRQMVVEDVSRRFCSTPIRDSTRPTSRSSCRSRNMTSIPGTRRLWKS